MAIIKYKTNQPKTIIKAKIDQTILAQMEQYCEWSGIFDLGYFIEQAALYVFRKDMEWKEFTKKEITTEA